MRSLTRSSRRSSSMFPSVVRLQIERAAYQPPRKIFRAVSPFYAARCRFEAKTRRFLPEALAAAWLSACSPLLVRAAIERFGRDKGPPSRRFECSREEETDQ